jgi:GTP cyclohydrolase I
VLEEDLARQVAEALVRHTGARGAACILEAEQLCVTVRGPRRARARTHVEAFAGVLARDRALQRRVIGLAARGAPARGSRRR